MINITRVGSDKLFDCARYRSYTLELSRLSIIKMAFANTNKEIISYFESNSKSRLKGSCNIFRTISTYSRAKKNLIRALPAHALKQIT